MQHYKISREKVTQTHCVYHVPKRFPKCLGQGPWNPRVVFHLNIQTFPSAWLFSFRFIYFFISLHIIILPNVCTTWSSIACFNCNAFSAISSSLFKIALGHRLHVHFFCLYGVYNESCFVIYVRELRKRVSIVNRKIILIFGRHFSFGRGRLKHALILVILKLTILLACIMMYHADI